MNTLTGYLRQAGTALRFLLLATVVLGLAYPLAIFGAGQLIAPYQANGSILKDDGGAPAASALIAQSTADDAGAQDPKWFHARPSAVTWDPASSSATNLGPNDPKLLDAVTANRAAVAAAEGVSDSGRARGRRDCQRLRTGPGHLPGLRPAAGSPGGRRPRAERRRSPGPRRTGTPAADSRPSWASPPSTSPP